MSSGQWKWWASRAVSAKSSATDGRLIPPGALLYLRQVDLERSAQCGHVTVPTASPSVFRPLVEALQGDRTPPPERPLDYRPVAMPAQVTEPRHDALQQEHREVRLVLAHDRRRDRLELVARRRQPHRALAVEGAVGADEARAGA